MKKAARMTWHGGGTTAAWDLESNHLLLHTHYYLLPKLALARTTLTLTHKQNPSTEILTCRYV